MLAVGSQSLVNIVSTKNRDKSTVWEASWAIAGITGYVSDLAMTKDGMNMAFTSECLEYLEIRDVTRPAEGKIFAQHNGCGQCICTSLRSGLRRSVDDTCPIIAHTHGLCAVTFSPCGKRVATGGLDNTAIIWNISSRSAEIVIKFHTSRVSDMSFSACGSLLVTCSWDGMICTWDATTGDHLHILLHEVDLLLQMPVNSVQICPTNPNEIASSCVDENKVVLWDLGIAGGVQNRDAQGCRFAIYSPDGLSIATVAGLSGTFLGTVLRLFRAETGELRFLMYGHSCDVVMARFSPDSDHLISSDEEGNGIIWDTSTGLEMLQIELPNCTALTWAPDYVDNTNRTLAFTMGLQKRLGKTSHVGQMDQELVRMILDMV